MNIYKISDIVRDAIRDNNLIHNLPEGYCNFMRISAGELIGGQIMVMVFNVENTPVFSSYSIGSAISAFPAGMSFGRGCLVDPTGNIVTNPTELIDELSGYSHGWSIGAALEGGWSESPRGYKFFYYGVGTTPEVSKSYGVTFYEGNQRDF